MSGLMIDRERCIGCGRCVKACASSALKLVWEGPRKFAQVGDACVFCGSCVDACPVDAISISKDGAADTQELASYRGIWVFAQVDAAGHVMDVAFELLGRARQLAEERGCTLTALIGEGADGTDENAWRLVAAGADEVLVCRDARLARPDAEVFAHWICEMARAFRPEVILYGATAFGRELAPGVAVRLKTGLTADCTVLAMDPETGLLQQTRPAFGGNLMATIVCPAHRPQMATVRPGIFAAPTADEARTGEIRYVELDASVAPRVRVVDAEPVGTGRSIADAERLVVVGRGIGSKKNLAVARRLADALGAELGCTRPLVEAGWLEYPHQVGQTGVSVAPKLLVSLGVSGAIQHLAGIGGAQTVIAVNEDAEAPIFGAAHYKVVGDCIQVAEALIDALACHVVPGAHGA